MKLAITTAALLFFHTTSAFSIAEPEARSSPSRRDFLTQSVLSSLAVSLPFAAPANAVSGPNKVNAKLQGYGLPLATQIPDGFQPLLEIYGRGKNRTPLLVTFNHPLTWVVTLPSNDANGK